LGEKTLFSRTAVDMVKTKLRVLQDRFIIIFKSRMIIKLICIGAKKYVV